MASIPHTQAPKTNRRFKRAMSSRIATRWEEVWKVLPKAIAGDDPKAVHDARVASRRLRAAMDGAAGAFPKPWFRSLHKSAKTITRSLGKVRDQDVLLARLSAGREAADPAMRPALDLLIERIETERDEARDALEDTFTRSRLRRLRKESRTRFAIARQKDRQLEDALPERAREQIDARVSELLAFQGTVSETDDAETFHDARIAVKRLRYTLELFEEAVGAEATHLIGDLKGLQELLGDLHDLDVTIQIVGGELDRQRGGADDTVPHLAANLEAVLHRDQEARRRMREDVVAHWRDVMQAGFPDRLRGLTPSA